MNETEKYVFTSVIIKLLEILIEFMEKFSKKNNKSNKNNDIKEKVFYESCEKVKIILFQALFIILNLFFLLFLTAYGNVYKNSFGPLMFNIILSIIALVIINLFIILVAIGFDLIKYCILK